MPPVTHKVGRITTAIGLIGFGGALLYDNLLATQDATILFIKLWPLMLIGVGLEYLIRNALAQRNEQDGKLRFDWGGAILLVILLSAGITTFRSWVDLESGWLSVGVGPSVEHRETLAHGFILDREAVRRQLEAIDLQVTEGDTLRMEPQVPPELENVTFSYVIYAPSGLRIKAETGVGTMEVLGYQGELELHSRVGRIAVNAGSGSVTASSGSGRISVLNFEGQVSARTNLGDIITRNVTGP